MKAGQCCPAFSRLFYWRKRRFLRSETERLSHTADCSLGTRDIVRGAKPLSMFPLIEGLYAYGKPPFVQGRQRVRRLPYGKGRWHTPPSCLPFLSKGRCHK